jgi:hypothetical protein
VRQPEVGGDDNVEDELDFDGVQRYSSYPVFKGPAIMDSYGTT